MKTLGIIGLGAMGHPIAAHLIRNGFELYTTVRSQKSRDKANALGIHVLESRRDFAAHTDRILLLVSNYAQCTECLLGDDGVFSTFHKGSVILSSTVSPKDAEALAALCPDNVALIDAPVSGGAIGAEKGNLITITAGDSDAIDNCRDVLDCYCRKVVQVGNKAGQAQAVKAVNQMLVGIHMTATAEAMALSTAMGIDPQAMFETISDCSGTSNIFQSRMPKLIAGDFSARASLETLEKDTRICMDLAETYGVPSYLTNICHDLFVQTPRDSAVSEDACAVIRMYEGK